MLNIETYLITWNRVDSIHLTVNYYKKLGRVIVYDNFSTDGTREICEELGAEVRLFGKAGVLDDQAYLDIKNECWKGSKADWVIVVDDDEILYHTHLIDVLTAAKAARSTIFKTQGFNMFSNEMPVNDWMEVKTGIKEDKYSKTVIFNPSEVKEIGYIFGCHEARPKGNIKFDLYELILLHYNAVGGAQRMIDRHALYEPRRLKSPINVRWGLGKEYGYSAESKRKWFNENLLNSSKLSVFV